MDEGGERTWRTVTIPRPVPSISVSVMGLRSGPIFDAVDEASSLLMDLLLP